MLAEQRFHMGTVEINYGEGPPTGAPLVILHGGAANWRYADHLIDLLVARWHVFAPDFRGHGQSGRVPGRYALADYTADTAAFLAKVVGGPAVVFGHSLGGEVAVMVAAQYPALVRAVVVGDVPFSTENHPTEEPGHWAMNELWHRLAGRPEAEIAAALRDMPVSVPGASSPVRAGDAFGEESPWFAFQAANLNRLDPGVLTAVLEGPEVMLAGYDPEVLLPAISCPVLILQADPAEGGLLSDAEVEKGLRLLPHARHVRLEGIGHELHGLHADRVLEAITPFLDAV
ncbi:MAG: alpha/beta hydrolase [Chloroflexota bacterium]|nr:alpha/beta hydrolase [Chloroflexota bacterium]